MGFLSSLLGGSAGKSVAYQVCLGKADAAISKHIGRSIRSALTNNLLDEIDKRCEHFFLSEETGYRKDATYEDVLMIRLVYLLDNLEIVNSTLMSGLHSMYGELYKKLKSKLHPVVGMEIIILDMDYK